MTFNYNDDKDKTLLIDDTLGRANFALYYARFIKSLIKNEQLKSFVIGLYGDWGSGKTTVINYVLFI